MVLRLFGDESIKKIKMVCLAAKTVHTPLTVSMDKDCALLAEVSPLCKQVKTESLDDFLRSLKSYDRVRTISAVVPDAVFEAAAAVDKYIEQAPPVSNGRIELARYIQEQSISNEYHRYGSQIEVPPVE